MVLKHWKFTFVIAALFVLGAAVGTAGPKLRGGLNVSVDSREAAEVPLPQRVNSYPLRNTRSTSCC